MQTFEQVKTKNKTNEERNAQILVSFIGPIGSFFRLEMKRKTPRKNKSAHARTADGSFSLCNGRFRFVVGAVVAVLFMMMMIIAAVFYYKE